jgi:hypothetical protein
MPQRRRRHQRDPAHRSLRSAPAACGLPEPDSDLTLGPRSDSAHAANARDSRYIAVPRRPRRSAGRNPAIGGCRCSSGNLSAGTQLGVVPGSPGPSESASALETSARNTSSTTLSPSSGAMTSPTNAHRVGFTRRPVSSKVSRRAHDCMLSPCLGLAPGSTQSPARSPRRMSRNRSFLMTTTEQRRSTSDSSSACQGARGVVMRPRSDANRMPH